MVCPCVDLLDIQNIPSSEIAKFDQDGYKIKNMLIKN